MYKYAIIISLLFISNTYIFGNENNSLENHSKIQALNNSLTPEETEYLRRSTTSLSSYIQKKINAGATPEDIANNKFVIRAYGNILKGVPAVANFVRDLQNKKS